MADTLPAVAAPTWTAFHTGPNRDEELTVYRPPLLLLCLSLVLTASVVLPAFGGDCRSDGNGNAATQISEAPTRVTLTGKLLPNSSTLPNQAPYVLLDAWGIARGYVSPGSVANLGPYLGHRVRITGRADSTPDGGRPHITVETIADSDQQHMAFTAPASQRPTAERCVRQVSYDEIGQEAAPGISAAAGPTHQERCRPPLACRHRSVNATSKWRTSLCRENGRAASRLRQL